MYSKDQKGTLMMSKHKVRYKYRICDNGNGYKYRQRTETLDIPLNVHESLLVIKCGDMIEQQIKNSGEEGAALVSFEVLD